MAKTSKGIYYPSDYNAIADVPEDMKQMAESIDIIVENEENNINTNTARITKLEQKKDMLSQQMPWHTVQGESIHIQDSALWDENKLSLSGNLKQEKREGYNKLKIKDETLISKGITSTAKDEVLNIKGTTESDWFNITSDTNKIDLSLKANTTYKLKLNKSFPSKAILVLRMYEEGSSTVAQSVRIENGNKNVEFSTSKDLVRGYFFIYGYTTGETVNITDLQIMITEGTEDKPYEKYGAMPSTEFPSMQIVATGVQKIRQFGKNWLDKDKANILKAYTSLTIVADENSSTLYIKCKNNTTYTISRTKVGKRFQVAECSELPKAGTLLNNLVPENFVNELKSITITTSSSARYLVVFYSNIGGVGLENNNGYTEEELRNSIQIEEGSVATEYEKYNGEDITLDLGTTELCAIKDANGTVVAQDRAVYRNGKWQWEKNVGKIIYNGTENWKWFKSGDAGLTASTTAYIILKDMICGSFLNGYCSHFFLGNSKKINTIRLGGNDNTVYIYLEDTHFSSIEAWRTFLQEQYNAGTPLTLYYILATPTYTDCTADQSAILDKLYNNFKLNKGVNNIIVETDNGVGVELDLSYMQDNNLKDSYETNEVNTGKKWIDGKDIYKKVVEVTNLSSGNNRIAHNINNLNELVDIRGTGNWNGNWQTIPRLVTDAVSTFGLGLGDINDTKFLIQVGSAYTNFTKAYIIIEYTKTVKAVE